MGAGAELAVPFKSQAQRRKFAQLLVEGKISPDTYEEWNRETGGRKLPDHVKPKARRKTGAKARSRKKTSTGAKTRTRKKRATRRST